MKKGLNEEKTPRACGISLLSKKFPIASGCKCDWRDSVRERGGDSGRWGEALYHSSLKFRRRLCPGDVCCDWWFCIAMALHFLCCSPAPTIPHKEAVKRTASLTHFTQGRPRGSESIADPLRRRGCRRPQRRKRATSRCLVGLPRRRPGGPRSDNHPHFILPILLPLHYLSPIPAPCPTDRRSEWAAVKIPCFWILCILHGWLRSFTASLFMLTTCACH